MPTLTDFLVLVLGLAGGLIVLLGLFVWLMLMRAKAVRKTTGEG